MWKFPVIVRGATDGDNVAVMPDFPMSIRLDGLDTPELHGELRQRPAAMVCKGALEFWIKQAGRVEVVIVAPDKYGCRWEGDLVSVTRKDWPPAAVWMLAQGYGRPYHGETKPPWTDHELFAIVTRGIPK
jgi:endonuclease YncB( thermonuclease family)